MSDLSRRFILAGALSAPVAALPAIANADPDDPVIELAARAVKAWHDFEAACDASTPFEEAMMNWRKANLKPEPSNQLRLPPGLAQFANHFDAVDIEAIAPLLTAEEKAAVARAARNWRRRELRAEKRTGYAAAKAAEAAASDVVNDLVDELRAAVLSRLQVSPPRRARLRFGAKGAFLSRKNSFAISGCLPAT